MVFFVQAAFVASHKAHASLSAKPRQEADVVEPVLCTVCQISCISKEAYASHKYGKRHRHNLELQSGKVPGQAVFPKEVMTRQNRRIRRRSRKVGLDHMLTMLVVCAILTCQSQVVFDSHAESHKIRCLIYCCWFRHSLILRRSKRKV